MKNLFNPAIECTDPDTLQFCLKISGNEFWYCDPNTTRTELLLESGSKQREIYLKYKGYPKQLITDAATDPDVKAFIQNKYLWLTAFINVHDFHQSEKLELLNDYGYKWDSFSDDPSRNQIIAENYFEQNCFDFTNDY